MPNKKKPFKIVLISNFNIAAAKRKASNDDDAKDDPGSYDKKPRNDDSTDEESVDEPRNHDAGSSVQPLPLPDHRDNTKNSIIKGDKSSILKPKKVKSDSDSSQDSSTDSDSDDDDGDAPAAQLPAQKVPQSSTKQDATPKKQPGDNLSKSGQHLTPKRPNQPNVAPTQPAQGEQPVTPLPFDNYGFPRRPVTPKQPTRPREQPEPPIPPRYHINQPRPVPAPPPSPMPNYQSPLRPFVPSPKQPVQPIQPVLPREQPGHSIRTPPLRDYFNRPLGPSQAGKKIDFRPPGQAKISAKVNKPSSPAALLTDIGGDNSQSLIVDQNPSIDKEKPFTNKTPDVNLRPKGSSTPGHLNHQIDKDSKVFVPSQPVGPAYFPPKVSSISEQPSGGSNGQNTNGTGSTPVNPILPNANASSSSPIAIAAVPPSAITPVPSTNQPGAPRPKLKKSATYLVDDEPQPPAPRISSSILEPSPLPSMPRSPGMNNLNILRPVIEEQPNDPEPIGRTAHGSGPPPPSKKEMNEKFEGALIGLMLGDCIGKDNMEGESGFPGMPELLNDLIETNRAQGRCERFREPIIGSNITGFCLAYGRTLVGKRNLDPRAVASELIKLNQRYEPRPENLNELLNLLHNISGNSNNFRENLYKPALTDGLTDATVASAIVPIALYTLNKTEEEMIALTLLVAKITQTNYSSLFGVIMQCFAVRLACQLRIEDFSRDQSTFLDTFFKNMIESAELLEELLFNVEEAFFRGDDAIRLPEELEYYFTDEANRFKLQRLPQDENSYKNRLTELYNEYKKCENDPNYRINRRLFNARNYSSANSTLNSVCLSILVFAMAANPRCNSEVSSKLGINDAFAQIRLIERTYLYAISFGKDCRFVAAMSAAISGALCGSRETFIPRLTQLCVNFKEIKELAKRLFETVEANSQEQGH